MKFLKPPRGFTLIELLVVISVIGLLSGVVLVGLTRAREKGKIAAVQSFVANLYHAEGADAAGMWELDECSGNAANDSSSRSNNGTINSATWSTTQVPFPEEKCSLYFNGSGFIRIPSDPKTMDLGSSGFSYTAWIYPTALDGTYNMVMGRYLPYLNIRSSGELHLSLQAAGDHRYVYGATKLMINKWYHVAATYDSEGYMRVYVDGKLDGMVGPYPNPSNFASDFYIGQYSSSGAYKFRGHMSQVHFYNHALSYATIKNIYADGLPEQLAGNMGIGMNERDEIE